MEFQCPKCSSSELRSCAVVWREGTTDGRGAIVGGSFGSSGFQPAAASTSQHGQTLLAQQCAPPRERSTWSSIWGTLLLVLGVDLLIGRFWVLGIPAVLLGVYCFRLFMQAQAYNKHDLPDAVRRWENTFVCSRCGELVTVHDPAQPSSETTGQLTVGPG